MAGEQGSIRKGLVREEEQRVQRVRDRTFLCPRPEEQHDRIGHNDRRHEDAPARCEPVGEDAARTWRLDAAPHDETEQQQPGIAEDQQPADAHPESHAGRDAELGDKRPFRARQQRDDADHIVDRPDHPDREGNVLRVVEHLAVVVWDRQQQERSDEASARTAEAARQLPASRYAEDAEKAIEKMARLVSAKGREAVQRRGDGVEGGAIIVEVKPVEAAAILKKAEIVIEDEDAVPIMNVLVPRHAIIGECGDDDEGDKAKESERCPVPRHSQGQPRQRLAQAFAGASHRGCADTGYLARTRFHPLGTVRYCHSHSYSVHRRAVAEAGYCLGKSGCQAGFEAPKPAGKQDSGKPSKPGLEQQS